MVRSGDAAVIADGTGQGSRGGIPGTGLLSHCETEAGQKKGKWLWKGLLFNAVILVTYWVLMHIFGFDQLASEFSEMGTVMVVLMLLLGNVTFFLLDKLLEKKFKR